MSMKIMVFLQGTTIMNEKLVGRSREERVKLTRKRDPEILDSSSQVPIGDAVRRLQSWKEGGAELVYLSAHRKPENTAKVNSILYRYGFPEGLFVFRQGTEGYADVAERVKPDIIVEDDCESIGGEKEMVYPHLKPLLKNRIRSVVVREFEGIDHLPDTVEKLVRLSTSQGR